MSGGHFDYKQYIINDIAEEIESIIDLYDTKDGHEYDYPESVIIEFKKAVKVLKEASIYAQRIDWLLSGDDGVESFHERLTEELK